MATKPIEKLWTNSGPKHWATYTKDASVYIGSGVGVGIDESTYCYDVYVHLLRDPTRRWVPQYSVQYGGNTGVCRYAIQGFDPTGIDSIPLRHVRELLETSWWELISQVEAFK